MMKLFVKIAERLFLQKCSIIDARLSSKYGSGFTKILPTSRFFNSFKDAFRVRIWDKILHLEKLRKNGDFTLLNKSLEPYKLP